VELIILWIVCAFVAAAIASAKGRSAFGWFILGLLFSVFAVLVVLVLPSKNRPTSYGPRDRTKDCPDCAEEVLAAANVCKHCGYRFS